MVNLLWLRLGNTSAFVYKSKITIYGNWGISWIDNWALTQGKTVTFFKDEPTTPDYIKKLAE